MMIAVHWCGEKNLQLDSRITRAFLLFRGKLKLLLWPGWKISNLTCSLGYQFKSYDHHIKWYLEFLSYLRTSVKKDSD